MGKRPSVASAFGLREDIDNLVQRDNTIDLWAFDREIYKDIYTRSKTMRDTVKRGENLLRPYPDLAEDIFHSLHKHRPNLMDEEEVTASHQFNRQLIEELMETDDYRRLRANTRFDTIASALGAEIIQEEALQRIERARQDYLQKKQAQAAANGQDPNQVDDDFFDLINQMYEAEQQAGNIQGQLDSGVGKSGKKLNATQAAKLAAAQAAAQQRAKALGQQLQQSIQQNGNPLQQVMQGAASKAATEVGEVSEMLGEWGIGGGDPNIRITYEDKKSALRRLRASNKLKDFAKLVGRFKKLAIQEQKRKVPDGKTNIKDIITGNDLTCVIPSEYMMLAHPTLKKIFYQKFIQQNLLMYDKNSIETSGKGPIIACVDVSGSMQNDRERWAKAVALALLEVAQKQKRSYACIHFNEHPTFEAIIPYGTLKPNMIFDIAEKFAGGGTKFEPVLRRSLEILQKDKFNKADIVFITDGDAYVSDTFIEEFHQIKRQKQFRVNSVLIDVGGDASKGTVSRFSDKIVAVSNMANLNESAAANIFASV